MVEMIISGYTVLLDDEDYERLKDYKYHVNKSDAEKKELYYFIRHTTVDGKRTGICIHRDVMCCVNGDGKTVDHKDGNTLDNRKTNLRPGSNTENCRNSRMRRSNTSGIKGVCWNKEHGKWHAQITVNRKVHSLGFYTDIKDAEKAYAEGSILHHGDFGRVK